MKPRAWFVYVLECEGGRLYTGVSPDVVARFAAHRRGRGGAFTRSFPPRRILAAKRCGLRGAALSAEHALKQLERPEKLAWVRRWRWRPRPAEGRAFKKSSPVRPAARGSRR